MTHYTDSNLLEAGWTNPTRRRAFMDFMRWVNRVVEAQVGMNAEHFADADWAGLYEGLGDDVTAEIILDTLADADDLFRAMLEA